MQTIPAFYFHHETLQALAQREREGFLRAQPFRHAVIDHFLPDEIAQQLVAEFPGPKDIPWERGDEGEMRDNVRNSGKLGHSQEKDFGPLTRHVMLQFYSATFLKFLGTLTGQVGLIMDPHFRGGGLHSTGRGGKLMVHADKSRHPNRKLDQIINLIYFLNPDWQEAWGGHLELWNKELTECRQRILPVSNRLVIFQSGTCSYHGHPQPLECPEDRRRNSFALYYYMIERPRDVEYEGFRNYVDWVPTTEEEKQMPLRETRPQLFRFEGKDLESDKKNLKPDSSS